MSFFSPVSKMIAVTALSVALAASAKADPVVQNGSFETAQGPGQIGLNGNYNVAGWTSAGYNFLFNPASATTTGSTSYNGQVRLSPYGADLTSPDGGNFIGMDGNFRAGPFYTTVTGLTVGQLTNVSFDYAGSQQQGYSGPTQEGFNVSLGSQTLTTGLLSDAQQGFTGWHSITLQFTPTSTSEVLSFMAINTPGGEPPFSLLDGVKVTNAPNVAATPEPSSLLLLGTGLAGAAAAMRRRFTRK